MTTRIAHNPFRSILQLSLGDFLAKILHFFTFIYLARILGVTQYGVLEFAISSSIYFLFLADAGLEGWATREASTTSNLRALAGRILPLRLLLSAGSFTILVITLSFFPDYPRLRALLLLFGAAAFLQAMNLKWSLLATQRMALVGTGYIVMQTIFAACIFLFVRTSDDLLTVAIARLFGDLAMTAFYGFLFVTNQGGWPERFQLTGAFHVLRPAAVIGASSFLALMLFNFDSVFLGFLIGPEAVAWYNAAYKPVSMVLAVSATYFVGLFPILSRQFAIEPVMFEQTVTRSVRLTAAFGVPVVVGGTLLAEPLIDALFGAAYRSAAPVLPILVWSALAVLLRGTLKQGLIAANHQSLELRCAVFAISCNVILNILLIPRFGVIGAAIATVAAEAVWLVLLFYYFSRRVRPLPLLSTAWKPAVAGGAMALFLLFVASWNWILAAFLGTLLYAGVLFSLGERFQSVQSEL